VVGRFVEEENIRISKERLSEENFYFIVVGDFAEFFMMEIGSDAEAREERGRVAVRFPTAEFGEERFEVARLLAVFF